MTTLNKGAALVSCGLMALLLAACGGSSSSPDTGMDPTGGSEPLDDTDLYKVLNYAKETFDFDVIDALSRAARAIPRGASQSSRVVNRQTMTELKVLVPFKDGNSADYKVQGKNDGQTFNDEEGFRFSLFTDQDPAREIALDTVPHHYLGIWEWNGEIGTFWTKSPSLPETVALQEGGRATYKGNAVGLHAAGNTTTRFLANVSLEADFATGMVCGTVDKFRSLAGTSLDDLSVTLGQVNFSQQGNPFYGNTTGSGGDGKWGARWADDKGNSMGGTFGFAKTDNSLAVLGAFHAAIPGPTTGGNSNDPVTTTSAGN